MVRLMRGISRTPTADEASTMTVTDPNQNQSIYQAGSGAITSAQIYAGPTTGTPVRQYVITYNADDDPWVDYHRRR